MRNPDRAGRQREDEKNRIWRLQLLVLKKDMVKMNIDKDGYLNVSIENKEEKKDDVKHIEVK